MRSGVLRRPQDVFGRLAAATRRLGGVFGRLGGIFGRLGGVFGRHKINENHAKQYQNQSKPCKTMRSEPPDPRRGHGVLDPRLAC